MSQLKPFRIEELALTQYLFFTGKGGVGKTSAACATAVSLADRGKKVLLVSTDPASNLQDVFGRELNGQGVAIAEVPGLVVANLNPEEAARDYRDSVLAPYRGILPESAITNMEEQMSGSCTVEIAAFDQFSCFITQEASQTVYDHVVFDTAPTGHTLRLLQLPSAWSGFIEDNVYGASCLGPLAGLEERKTLYHQAMENLSDAAKTTLILVSRPEKLSLLEAERTRFELSELGIQNQVLLLNGLLQTATDELSRHMLARQQDALLELSEGLRGLKGYFIPLRSYNIVGLERIRSFLKTDDPWAIQPGADQTVLHSLKELIEDVRTSGKRVIFTMGKGGVGKTTVAASIALALAEQDVPVRLTSTDPADHLDLVAKGSEMIHLTRIDEDKELLRYQTEVLDKARESMEEEDLAYLEEDLRSPCTQEIALFRAFAEVVDDAENEVVVIDTAPTGHTLLLLDSTQSYHKEVQRTKGETPRSVQRLLPRLRDKAQTEVVIVTLPEATPVFEAERLQEDLERAGISTKWWIANQCLSLTKTQDPTLLARAQQEQEWLSRAALDSQGHLAAIPWLSDASPDAILSFTGYDNSNKKKDDK